MYYERIGEEVYIAPSDTRGDCIAKIIGGEDGEYETTVGAWFYDKQLMPTRGLSLEGCREECEGYFGHNPDELRRIRGEAFAKTVIGKSMAETMKVCSKIFNEALNT